MRATRLLEYHFVNKNANKVGSVAFYNNAITNGFRLILEGRYSKAKTIHLEEVIK
jgi:hypothetical protein